jgi:hypothetical protein
MDRQHARADLEAKRERELELQRWREGQQHLLDAKPAKGLFKPAYRPIWTDSIEKIEAPQSICLVSDFFRPDLWGISTG